MVARFYTYLHRRPDDGRVFYVGKGTARRAHSSYRRPRRWFRTVAKHGIAVEIVAMFWKEDDAFDHECDLIAQYRAEGQPLCNLTDGGDGPRGYIHNEEQRRKNADAQRGKKQSPETIAKRVAKLIGRKRSPEARANISASCIGRRVSDETKKKIGDANRGRIRSEDFRIKISSAMTGRPCSPETREKISSAQRGKSRSWYAERRELEGKI